MSRRRRIYSKQPKLKNVQIISKDLSFTASVGDFRSYASLIENPGNYPGENTGYVETIGRFSLDCVLEGVNTLNNVALFVMYLPEGYSMTASDDTVVKLPSYHPEWIMAYKYLGSPTDGQDGQGCQPLRIRTRVRRNLMTGDRVILFVSGTNSGNSVATCKVWSLLKFASKIN